MIRNYAQSLLLTLSVAACPAPADNDTDASASSTGEPASSTGEPAGSTGEPEPTGGTTGAPACVEDDLAPSPFAGPGWDAEMGALKEPLQDEYIASTTLLVLRPETVQDFIATVGTMVPVLEANPGIVGYSLAQSMKCGTARTLTVWRDEAAMMQFVMSDEHVAGMSKAGEYSSTGTVTSWKLPRAEVPVTWEAAMARVAAATPSY
jgi:heme-degrading monooxygenase HmoA